MRGKAILWLIPLFLTGCAATDAGGTPYAAGPLQPDNCGTPDRYKPCVRPHGVAIRQVKPEVTIEVLTAPRY